MMEYRTYEVNSEDPAASSTTPKWRVFQWPIAAGCLLSVPAILSLPQMMVLGGGAFLVPFFLLGVFFVGPLLYVQLKLGSVTECNIVTMFGRSIPILKGVGIAAMIYMAIFAAMFQVALAYALVFAFDSVKSDPLPWSSCANAYNTPYCRSPSRMPPPDQTPPIPNNTFLGMNETLAYLPPAAQSAAMTTTASHEYFLYRFLMMSQGYGEMGKVLPYLAGALGLMWLFTFLLTCWGPRVYGYIIMVLSAGTYTVLFLLMGRGYGEMPQLAQMGLDVYYTPNWESLKSKESWAAALKLLFMATYVLNGILPTFGKFAGSGRRTSNLTWIPVLVFTVLIPNLLVILLAPYLALLVKGYARQTFFWSEGGDILFMRIPDLAVLVDNGLISFLFFLWALLQGLLHQSLLTLMILDSITEGFKEILHKIFHRKFVARIPVCALLCLVMYLVALPFVTQGGSYIMYLLMTFLQLPIPILFLLSFIAYAITYAKQTRFSKLQKILVLVVFCVISVVVVFLGMYSAYEMISSLPVRFPGYIFPESSNLAGWMVAILPLAFGLLAGLFHAFFSAHGNCRKRLVFLFKGAPVPRPRKIKSKEGVVSMRPVAGLGDQSQPLMTGEKKSSA